MLTGPVPPTLRLPLPRAESFPANTASVMGCRVSGPHTVIGAIACVAPVIARNVLILFRPLAAA